MKIDALVSKFDEMYDRYIQLLSEDRFKEAAEIGQELAEFNTELDQLESI